MRITIAETDNVAFTPKNCPYKEVKFLEHSGPTEPKQRSPNQQVYEGVTANYDSHDEI